MHRITFTDCVFVVNILILIWPTIGYRNLSDIIREINKERKTELNIFINLNPITYENLSHQFEEIAQSLNHLARVIKTDGNLVTTLQNSPFPQQSLTVAWLTQENANGTFKAIDTLLWQLHFKDILLIYHNPEQLDQDLLSIFQICWEYGFTSVLVWCNQQLYTYHPYPVIAVNILDNVSQFSDKSHLDNFQLYAWSQPTTEMAPRFFSYKTRKGQLMYAGYLYTIISVFLTHHNSTVIYYYLDFYAPNITRESLIRMAYQKGFVFAPVVIDYSDFTLACKALYLGKVILMVPTAKEIPESLYLLVAFDVYVYLITALCGLLFFLLINCINFQRTGNIDASTAFLEAYKIIIFASTSSTAKRSMVNFYLNLLFLFTGIFLTNYYSSSLSSLYTSKLYEPELEKLIDIERTNLKIFIFSLDLMDFQQLELLPAIIYQRLYIGDDNELFAARRNLNMTYIYGYYGDRSDYLLMQQMYLKKTIAKELPEVLLYRPLFVSMTHRSPLFEQVNRYLSYIRDSGLLKKFQEDANWEGFLSGHLRIFMDPEAVGALEMEYFEYAFIMWAIGISGGSFCFLIEAVYGRWCSLL